MLKYTIFKQGFKQNVNIIRCPNCGSTNKDLKGNVIDSVYTCNKCCCRFLIESDIDKLNKSE